jgi:hypothetical protein
MVPGGLENKVLIDHIMRILTASGGWTNIPKAYDDLYVIKLSERERLVDACTARSTSNRKADMDADREMYPAVAPDYIGSIGSGSTIMRLYSGIGIEPDTGEFLGYIALRYSGSRLLSRKQNQLVKETKGRIEASEAVIRHVHAMPIFLIGSK